MGPRLRGDDDEARATILRGSPQKRLAPQDDV